MEKVLDSMDMAFAGEPVDHGGVGRGSMVESSGIGDGLEEVHGQGKVRLVVEPVKDVGFFEERGGGLGGVEDEEGWWFWGFGYLKHQGTSFFQVHFFNR